MGIFSPPQFRNLAAVETAVDGAEEGVFLPAPRGLAGTQSAAAASLSLA